MSEKAESAEPVRAKAVLVDPSTMTVLWMNEAAAQDVTSGGVELCADLPLAQAVPLAQTLGIPEALCLVAEDGMPRHLRADLVSTTRGRVEIVSSVYRLPDGMLLLLMENAWRFGRGERQGRSTGRSRAHGR